MSTNVTWHDGEVGRGDRPSLGATVWLTGLSGSGKSTVGAALERTDERSRARRSPSPCSPTGRTQTSHLRNLAADIIAAHDAIRTPHAIDTADATPEHS